MEEQKTEQKKEIRWKAYEYVYHEKSIDWYWYFGLISILLTASAIYLKNMMFAFIIAIGSFSMLLYASKRPREIEYIADKKGISFDGASYFYQEILFFWIVDNKKRSEEKLLLLQLKKTTSTLVVLPLGDIDVDNIRTFLLNLIEEKEIDVPMSYVLMNVIGF
jgi:hypothetical protein